MKLAKVYIISLVFLFINYGIANAKENIELTPLGGIKNGNLGDIPAWQEGQTNTLDKTIQFTINFSNYKQHQDNLTAGQIALFEAYPDTFRMPIYSTQRTAVAPQWVYKNTKENIDTARLNKDQSGFENAKAGIPFAIPESALEVYFNHISRWRGLQVESIASDAVVLKNGKYSLITRQSLARFDHYIKDLESEYFVSVIGKTLAPATRSGSGVLVLEPLDQLNKSRSAWLWDKGRRRVIRAPNVAYDQPIATASALRTSDDTDMINGSPDRFNWELLEKREIYLPYNNETLASKDLRYKQILDKGHINPELTRYELHRAWVIRATLKDKWRHVYTQRDFYIDEDSWQVLVADQYNKQGELWRVSMSYPKFYKQLPGLFPVINVYHDLQSKEYHVMGLKNEQTNDIVFNGEIAKNSLFTPSGFKRYMR